MSHKAYEIQLADHCSILQQFFHQFKADDIDVYVKESHIIAVDGYGNQWKDSEVYDFILNECLAWDTTGNLKDGFASVSNDLAAALKRHAASYEVKIRN